MPPKRRTRTRSPSPSSHQTRRQPRLTPTTLSIPASRVRKTWRPLPQPTQERIKALLLAIQSQSLATLQANTMVKSRGKSLRALYKIPSSKHSTVTSATTEPDDHQTAITTLISRLTRSLPKMTFPPNGTSRASAASTKAAAAEQDLSLPATLNRTATLAAQLSQATQSAKLLKMQIRSEERDLKRDTDELRVLEENMRRAVGVDREREREGRLHGVALAVRAGVDEREGAGRIGEDEHEEDERIHEAASTARSKRKQLLGHVGFGKGEIEKDADLQALTDGLRSHLGSMRANTAGMEGVRRQLRRAEREVGLWGVRREVEV